MFKLVRSNRGQSFVEYAIVFIAIVVLIVAVASTTLKGGIDDLFGNSATAIKTAAADLIK